MKLRVASLLCALALIAFAFVAFGAPPTVAGSPQIQALTSELAALTARVDKLEGQITAADLVGTYTLHGIQNEMDTPSLDGVPAQISSYVYVGTVMLNADGTASFINLAQTGNNILLAPPNPVRTADSAPSSGSGTWSYANGAVTLSSLGGTPPALSVAAGGRVLVGASANHSDGTDVILILTRLQ